MIKITNTKIFNNIPAYEVSSDKGMTIKNIHTGKELPKFVSIKPVTANDYIETTRTVEDYNKEQKYNELIKSKLAAKGYDVDTQLAILYNTMINPDDKAEKHTSELEEFKAIRKECKDEAYLEVYGNRR